MEIEAVHKDTLLEGAPESVVRELERLLNILENRQKLFGFKNSEGECLFSDDDIELYNTRPSPGQTLLAFFRSRRVCLEELQFIFRQCNMYDLLDIIITNDPLKIVRPTKDQLIFLKLGQTYELYVHVDGSPFPKFQWRYNDQILQDEVSSSLIFDKFRIDQIGKYECLVTQVIQGNIIQLLSPKFDILPSQTAPFIQDHPESVAVETGEVLKLKCLAQGHPTPNYQWYKDDELLSSYSSCNLEIPDVDLKNSGSYKCKVFNSVGEMTSKSSIVKVTPVVLAPSIPVIIRQPKGKASYSIGETVELSCGVHCGQPVEFSCYINGSLLNSESCYPHVFEQGAPVRGAQSTNVYSCYLQYDTRESDRGESNSIRIIFECKAGIYSVSSNEIEIRIKRNEAERSFFARNKFALCIANEDYTRPDKKLTACVKDMRALAKELIELGFRCMEYSDLATREEMERAVLQFSEFVQKGDYVAFYYAGHGFHNNGVDLMMPTEARYEKNEAGVETSPFQSDCLQGVWIHNRLQEREPALLWLFYDTCRKQPFQGKPLPTIKDKYKTARPNTYLICATSENYSAHEVEGSHSYVRKHLTGLIKNSKRSVIEIGNDLLKDFQYHPDEVCRYQIPVIDYNLALDLSLGDPCRPMEGDEKGVLQCWEECAGVGGALSGEITMEEFNLIVSVQCQQKGASDIKQRQRNGPTWIISNTIVVYIKILSHEGKLFDLKRLADRGYNLHAKFSNGYEKQVQLNDKTSSPIRCIVKGLQKIKEKLSVDVVIRCRDIAPSIHFNLGWPSVASYNKTSNDLNK